MPMRFPNFKQFIVYLPLEHPLAFCIAIVATIYAISRFLI